MIIRGFQKLTLLDYPGHTACTVFTGGCNMRCLYCHNSGLVLSANDYPEIPEKEVFALLDKRKGILDGVCITGGEPMLQKDLPDFVGKIKGMGYLVKIDTNGSYPRQLAFMLSNGMIDYVAMDIKNCESRYGETIGRPEFDLAPVKESIRLLESSGVEHEYRTTVCKNLHTPENLADIFNLIGTGCNFYVQAYKDSESVMDRSMKGYSPYELKTIVTELKKINPKTSIRGI